MEQHGDWRVLYDKVLVRRDKPLEEKGGMAVPETHRRSQSSGVILEVGSGRPGRNGLQPLIVQTGDSVKFTAFSGVPLDEDDPDVIVLREDEILAYRREGF